MTPYNPQPLPYTPQFANPYTSGNPYLTNPYNIPGRTVQQQEYTPQQHHMVLSGRVVKSVNDITPDETPMNGTCAYFPSEDGSSILMRYRNGKGVIEDVVYSRVETVEGETVENDTPGFVDILDKLNNIENVLSSMSDSKTAPKKTTSRSTAKKETTNA